MHPFAICNSFCANSQASKKLQNFPAPRIRSTSSTQFSKKPRILQPAFWIRSISRATRKAASGSTATSRRPKALKKRITQFAKAGWIGLPVPAEYGGQGLPQLMLGPTLEMWNGANVGFANGPLLNQGAIEAIELVGSDEQKKKYIPKLVSGEWTGTMCLTEPQAGSDLAAVRTKAVPEGDHYRLSGQKIFITFGEHDLAPNIIHLVLARLPDAPEGTKGISMFIVREGQRQTPTARSASATTSCAPASSTRWASTAIPRAR